MNRQDIPPIDWEDLMTSAERSAGIAAKMSVRTVSALAEVLEKQRRHSHLLNQLEKACDEIRARPAPTPPSCIHQPSPTRPPLRARPLHLFAAFAAGAAFAGFFASW